MKKKLLITGASGFLGHALCAVLASKYELIGTYFRNLPDQEAVKWVCINLLETNKIEKLVAEYKPDAILHLAAISNTTFCEQHPALSHHINVYTTVALAEAAATLQIPLLYTSTDLVFNGHSAPYEEDDFTYPISQYGEQKQMAEELLLTEFERTLIIRLPLLFGLGPAYTNNFYQSSVAALKEGGAVVAFTDEYRSMLHTQVASQGIALALAYALAPTPSWGDKERLFHLGADQAYSRYDFMVAVAKSLGISTKLITPSLQEQAPHAHTRPANVALNNTLAKEILGFSPPSLEIQLQMIIE
ncbi:MAG: NAD(P)-dependent oxidoreductase [Aureispira sp.]